MGGLFKAVSPVAMLADALNKKKSDAPIIAAGVTPADKPADPPADPLTRPMAAKLDTDDVEAMRKKNVDSLGKAAAPKTIISATAPGYG